MNAPSNLDFARLSPATKRRLKKLAQARLAQIDAERDRKSAEDEARARAVDPAALDMAAWRRAELKRCAEDPIYWINTYVWTFNPKLSARKNPDGTKVNPFMRFKLWPRQEELILWLQARVAGEEQGAIPKSRDIGASYLCAAFSLHGWLFTDAFKATFGSRIKEYVDDRDNPDAIFPKLRIMLTRLPEWMIPEGFEPRKHDIAFKLINPANEAIITGEGGKNMGRGGRSTVYFLDEAAHVDNADDVEAALTGNTDCIIWVSSVNGTGNLFYRKVMGGSDMGLPVDQLFFYHYRDDPRKTPEWIAKKKRVTSAVKWAQEYEIDFNASLEGVCIPGKFVTAAKALSAMIQGPAQRSVPVGGLDVGAGGKGKSIFIARSGPFVMKPKSRREADTTGTAIWGYNCAEEAGCAHLNYDAPGVGAGVTSTYKHVKRKGITVHAINTGSDPFVVTGRWDSGQTSKEQFYNLRMELWWIMRTRLQKSYELWLFLTGNTDEAGDAEPKEWPISDILVLPSGDEHSEMLATQLSSVKVEVKENGIAILESKKALAKRGVASPDYADALALSIVQRRKTYDISALA